MGKWTFLILFFFSGIAKADICAPGQLRLIHNPISGQWDYVCVGGGGASIYPATSTAYFPYGLQLSTASFITTPWLYGGTIVNHSNGTQSIHASTGPDSGALGSTLINAVELEQDGDVIFISSGIFNVGQFNIDLTNSGTLSCDLHGVTWQGSTITASAGATMITLGNSKVTDLSIIGIKANVFQFPIGLNNVYQNFTTGYIKNVYTYSPSDGYYSQPFGSSAFTINIINSIFTGPWDTFFTNNNNLGQVVNVYNSTFSAIQKNGDPFGLNTTRPECSYGSGLNNFWNCLFFSSATTGADANGLTIMGGITNVYGGKTTTFSSGGSALDINVSGGVLNIDSVFSYDPSKTSGSFNIVSSVPDNPPSVPYIHNPTTDFNISQASAPLLSSDGAGNVILDNKSGNLYSNAGSYWNGPLFSPFVTTDKLNILGPSTFGGNSSSIDASGNANFQTLAVGNNQALINSNGSASFTIPYDTNDPPTNLGLSLYNPDGDLLMTTHSYEPPPSVNNFPIMDYYGAGGNGSNMVSWSMIGRDTMLRRTYLNVYENSGITNWDYEPDNTPISLIFNGTSTFSGRLSNTYDIYLNSSYGFDGQPGNIPYYITTGDTGASFVRADGFNGAGSNYYWSDPTIGFPDSYNYLGGFSFGSGSAVWYGNDGAGDQSEFMQSIFDGGTGAFDTVFNGSIAGNGSQLSIQPLGTNIIYGAPLSYLVDTSWTNTFADSQSNGQIANFLTSDNSQGNFYISNGLNQSATTGLLFGYGRGTPQNTDVYFQAVGNGNYYFFDNVGAFTNTVYMGNISAKGQFSVNLKVGTYMNVVGSMTVTGILGTSTTTISNNLSISSGAWITVSTNSGGGYMGTGTLSSGSATILTNKIHTGDYVFLTDTGNSITNLGSLEVQSITNGGSFLVKSSNVSDSSTFNWLILRASP